MAMDNYPRETSVVTLASRPGLPRIVPARDAFYTEVDAVRNAAEAASRTLVKDPVALATLAAIERVYYRLYIRQPGEAHPVPADFAELVEMVNATGEGRRAWAAFAQCLALAVPLQHCVNVALMSQDQVVECDKARLPASLGLALAGMADREFAAEFRKRAAEGMVVADPPAAEIMAAAEGGLVRESLRFAVEQMARQRGGQAKAKEVADGGSGGGGGDAAAAGGA